MNSLLVVGLLAAVALANADSFGGFGGHGHGGHAFHGYYPGKCGNDGFYYKDPYSFVICSNGNAYDQPCAPGTRNSEYGRYNSGHAYHYRDFCDVNLVDYGFGAHHSGYGHGGRAHGGYGGHGGHGFGGHHGGHHRGY